MHHRNWRDTSTATWGHINPKPGFVSAWDEARNHYGHASFDALPRYQQTEAVRAYVHREPRVTLEEFVASHVANR